MKGNSAIRVREMEARDIHFIADYWLQSTPDFLLAMGADVGKLPPREELTTILVEQIHSPREQKKSYALIWELDGEPIGHSNVNEIEFGKQAKMHLHLWSYDKRKKGLGAELVKKSLPFYFENLQLEVLFCEPYSLNPAPNKTLQKVGFDFEKKYTTIPGSLNFEQEVNRWRLSREKYEEMAYTDLI